MSDTIDLVLAKDVWTAVATNPIGLYIKSNDTGRWHLAAMTGEDPPADELEGEVYEGQSYRYFESFDGTIYVKVDTDDHPFSITDGVGATYSRLTDGFGNPIGSLKGALAIHDADVHNSAVNKLLHQHTATSTTLSADSAIDDYQITVADTAGFIVGNSLHINTGSIEVTHPVITAITPGTPGVLVLDRRLDRAHDAGDEVTNAIIDLASQIGTLAAPQIYWAGPEPGEVWHITHFTLAMGHNSAGDLGLFGNLTKLPNGVVLRAFVDGHYGTLTNWKTNGDINLDTGNIDFPLRSGGGGTHGTTADGPFKIRTGAVLRLDGDLGDRFEVYVQDDLTGIFFWSMKAQGHREGS